MVNSESIFAMLEQRAASLGSVIALSESGKALSYEEFEEKASRLAGGLYGLGLRPGDNVCIQLPNSIDMAVALMACWRIGLVTILLLPAYREGDILPLCDRIHPVAWIGEGVLLGFDYGALAKRILARAPSIRFVISRSENAETISLHKLMQSERLASGECLLPLPDDVAAVICTGGTTGFPKPVPRTHRQLLSLAEACCRRCGLDSSIVYLADLPLGHVFILAVPGLLGALLMGGRTVFALTAGTDEVFPLVESEKATMTTLVPPLLPIWLEAASWDDSDLSSLRIIEVGGAPVRGEMLSAIAETVGCRVQQAYGYTEGLVALTRPLGADEIGDASVQGLPVMEDDEIRIVLADGSDAPLGEKGELLSRGPCLCGRYYCCPELDGVFDADGFFHSGDQAAWVGNGSFSVCGRIKDLINRNGEKFSPLEIEEVVKRHPSIGDAVIVGVKNSEGEEIVCAWVMPQEDEGTKSLPTLSELRKFLLEEGLAAHKLPECMRVAEEWPKSAFGKILRNRLAELS